MCLSFTDVPYRLIKAPIGLIRTLIFAHNYTCSNIMIDFILESHEPMNNESTRGADASVEALKLYHMLSLQ